MFARDDTRARVTRRGHACQAYVCVCDCLRTRLRQVPTTAITCLPYHRSHRTPPGPTFKARLLHSKKGVGAQKGGVGKTSSVAVRKRVAWCWQPLCYGVGNRALQIGPGVCHDSDDYGILGENSAKTAKERVPGSKQPYLPNGCGPLVVGCM